MNTIPHRIDAESTAIAHKDGADHRIFHHRQRHVACRHTLHFAVSDSGSFINFLAACNLQFQRFALEQSKHHRIRIAHNPGERGLLQSHQLVLLGKLQIAHWQRGGHIPFSNQSGQAPRITFREHIHRKPRPTKQDARNANGQFFVQIYIALPALYTLHPNQSRHKGDFREIFPNLPSNQLDESLPKKVSGYDIQ